MQNQVQQQFYPGSFGISKKELVALKSATLAAPNMKLQVIRLFEGLRSSLDCVASMALAPSKEEVCMRKGGHIIRSAARKTTEIPCCHECGKKVMNTNDLRHNEDVQIQFHRNVSYWVSEGANSHALR